MATKSFYRSVDLINSIGKTTITNQLIKKTERILLAISGGQDSICLLILFNQLYAQMELHLGLFWCHHLWQIDSFSLMRQISKISFLFQFNGCFAIPSKFVPSELLARNWRHNSSYRICLFYNYSNISLAHSANDKVETILLNLMRGTGIAGLSPLHWTKKIPQESVQNEEHMSQHPTSLISIFSWSSRDLITTSLSAVPSHCPLGNKRVKQALGGLRSWESMKSVKTSIDSLRIDSVNSAIRGTDNCVNDQQSPKWHFYYWLSPEGDCQYGSKVNKSSDSFWFDGGFNKLNQQNKTIKVNRFIDGIEKPTRIYANKKCSDNEIEIEYLWRSFSTSQTKESIWDKAHLCWGEFFRLENLLHPSAVPKALFAFVLTVPFYATFVLTVPVMTLLTESTRKSTVPFRGSGKSIVPFWGPGDCALFFSIVDNKMCLKNPIDSLRTGKVNSAITGTVNTTVNSAIKGTVNKNLERVFFQKRIKTVKLKTKNRIFAKNKKESKSTTWFYFVSYTFFKNCSTSLE